MLLQSFIDPYQDHNQLVKVCWSPQNTTFERRVNRHDLYDSNTELKDRLTTFDGLADKCKTGRSLEPQKTGCPPLSRKTSRKPSSTW